MLLLLIVTVLILWWLNWSLYWWKRGVPYITPLPILGNCLPFAYKSSIEFFKDMYNQYPKSPYIGFFLCTRPILILKNPEIIHEVLEKKAAIFSSHGTDIDKRNDPIGGSVFHIYGSEWKDIRAVLSPHFTPSKVKIMSSVTEKSTEQLLELINTEIDNSVRNGINSAEVNFQDIATMYAVDSTASGIFGIESNVFRDRLRSQFVAVAKDLNTPISMIKVLFNFVSPYVYNKLKLLSFTVKAKKFMDDIMYALIDLRMRSPLPRPDFIQDMLKFIENKKEYDKETVSCQGAALWTGGIETTAGTLSFAMHELAMNQKLQTELRNKLGTEVGVNLLRSVIVETLRKYPIFMILFRRNQEPCQLSTGLKLDKDSLILIPISAIQNDPNIFENPEKFDPYRPIMKGCYLPFGLGPRICLGMRVAQASLENVLTKILENFTFYPGSRSERVLTLKSKAFFTSPANGIWIQFQRLEK